MENSAFYSQNLLIKKMNNTLPTVLSRAETQTPAPGHRTQRQSRAWEAEGTPARKGPGCGACFSAALDSKARRAGPGHGAHQQQL